MAKRMIERGAANIHWGQLNRDQINGPTLSENGGTVTTPPLERIITGPDVPVPRSGSITGAMIKRGVHRRRPALFRGGA